MDMRRPNKDALHTFAQALEDADHGDEIVADLATGVGKTYIAGGLLDYLYQQGVRNVVIITPGKTIQKKTIANLTPGHPKYMRGLQSKPLIVTLDDFEKGTVAAAMDDTDQFKVFIFTVQSLLRPDTKENRRAHRPHETLGTALYTYLQQADDLVVIADEHHVYFNKNAKKFKQAVHDLDPAALIGLTATPHETTDKNKIVYHYPLSEAIADGYVKIPVLVARPDGRSDSHTQMADGVALLDAKAAAIKAYAEKTGQENIQPILFVVASNIDEANLLRDILVGPDLLGSHDKVLLVTSEEPDETLQRLETLEHPHTPIRAVVSVSMLKEGWDVKNIYVIAAVRALESELLTEQILGRGLRLPYGRRTGVGMIDTVEVLSHHAFSDLLQHAEVYLSQTLGERASEADITPIPQNSEKETEETGEPSANPPVNIPVNTDRRHPTPPNPSGIPGPVTVTLPPHPEQVSLFDDGDGTREDTPEPVRAVGGFSTVQARLGEGKETCETFTAAHLPRSFPGVTLPLYLPKVTFYLLRPHFSLAHINTIDVEAYGAEFAEDNAPALTRKKLRSARDASGHVNVHIEDADDAAVTASTLPIPFNNIEGDLVMRILNSNAVAATTTEKNAATRLAQAFLKGAKVTADTPWREEHGRLATTALTGWISSKQASLEPVQKAEVTHITWANPSDDVPVKETPSDRQTVTNSRQFQRGHPYKGWAKSIYPTVTFDSYSAEFRLAELLETSPTVTAWFRITNNVPIVVDYIDGATPRTYHPDFVVIDNDGTRWLVEAKADNEMASPGVALKRKAAEKWVDEVNNSADIHKRWGYTLASESVIKTAPTWDMLKKMAQTHQ